MKALKQLNEWQLHTITSNKAEVLKIKEYYRETHNTTIHTDSIHAVSGNVLSDSTGKSKLGELLVSNTIVNITIQKDKYGQTRFVFETKDSIYLVHGKHITV